MARIPKTEFGLREVSGNYATSIGFRTNRDIVGLKLQSAFNFYFWLRREGLKEENG